MIKVAVIIYSCLNFLKTLLAILKNLLKVLLLIKYILLKIIKNVNKLFAPHLSKLRTTLIYLYGFKQC